MNIINANFSLQGWQWCNLQVMKMSAPTGIGRDWRDGLNTFLTNKDLRTKWGCLRVNTTEYDAQAIHTLFKWPHQTVTMTQGHIPQGSLPYVSQTPNPKCGSMCWWLYETRCIKIDAFTIYLGALGYTTLYIA